jgi:hypothetical protein
MGISNKVYPFDLTGWFGPPALSVLATDCGGELQARDVTIVSW